MVKYWPHAKEFWLLRSDLEVNDCSVVVTDNWQAEFLSKHVEGLKAVASMRVRSIAVHDDLGRWPYNRM